MAKVLQIDGQSLSDMLKRVYFKGLLEECVLTIKDGVGEIYAIDSSNNVFVVSKQKLSEEKINLTLGFNKLPIITYFLEGAAEKVEIIVDDKHITLDRGDKGKLKLLLSVPEMVSGTLTVDAEEEKVKALNGIEYDFDLEQSKVDALLKYISLLGSTIVRFDSTDGILTAASDEKNDQQFSLKVSQLLNTEMDLGVKVYSEALVSILKNLKWNKETPTLGLGAEGAMVIKQDDENMWFISPIIA